MRKNEGNDRSSRRRDLRLGLAVYGAGASMFLGGVLGISSVAGAESPPPGNNIAFECGQTPMNLSGGNQSTVDLQVHAGKTITVEGKGVKGGVAWEDTIAVTVARNGLNVDGTLYDTEDLHQPEAVKVHPDGFVGSIALISLGEREAGIAYVCPDPER